MKFKLNILCSLLIIGDIALSLYAIHNESFALLGTSVSILLLYCAMNELRISLLTKVLLQNDKKLIDIIDSLSKIIEEKIKESE